MTTPAKSAEKFRPKPGQKIADRYVTGRVLGEGNFGIVCEGQQLFFGEPTRRVAIKICKHKGVSPETIRDVFKDAFLLAETMDSLKSAEARSHLVHVFDLGVAPELDDRGYLVMEYVPGTTLAAQFASFGKVPASQLLKWMRQTCIALAGLHDLSEPVVHRDLKPDNVLLGVDLGVRLIDFGLSARLMSSGIVPGVAGTTTYMAPETSLGKSTRASDVYSVGLMLYEGLTGTLPFSHLVVPPEIPDIAHSSWLYEKKRNLDIAPPSAVNNTVTPELDTIILRCLKFDPLDRFPHAGTLLKALDDPTSATTGWEATVREVPEMNASGDLQGAREKLEQSLRKGSHSAEGRFRLLSKLGGVLSESGEHTQAAGVYKEAWELVQNTAILKTRQERSEVLQAIADCYRKAGNMFFAKKYQKRAEDEIKPR